MVEGGQMDVSKGKEWEEHGGGLEKERRGEKENEMREGNVRG